MVNVTNYVEAERLLIGAGLLDPDAIRFAIDECAPEDFTDPRLGLVYDLLISHRSARLGTDEITLAKAATERGMKVDAVDLFDLRHAVPTASNIGFYAHIVHEGSVRRRLRTAGTRFVQFADADEPLAETMTNARGEWEAVQSSIGIRLAAKPLGEVLAGSDEYDWLIPNLLERQDRVIITGGEGAGKSTFVRQMAVMAAAGVHPTLGVPIKPLRALVIDAENTEKQWRRATRTLTVKARRSGTADPEVGVQLACSPRIDITTDRDLGSIHRLVDEHNPDLLFIGPLYRLLPRAITNDDDAAPLITALDSLRDRGLALVMEAHAGHATDSDGNRNLRPRGSSALLGWPEFGLGIAHDRSEQVAPGQSPTLFHLVRWRGDRDERAWPASLRRGGDWPWEDADPTSTIDHIRRLATKAPMSPQRSTPPDDRYR